MLEQTTISIIIGLIWIIIATIFDIKTKEVPNWLNFSLIITIIAYKLLYSIITNNYQIILFGIIGLGIFLIIANLLYYARAFGGGDAKLLIGLGAIIWVGGEWKISAIYSIIFIVGLLLIGFVYGMMMSVIILMRKNAVERSKFFNEGKNYYKKNRLLFIASWVVIILIMVAGFYYKSVETTTLSLIMIILSILIIYSKAIERTILTKKVMTRELRVGDWLYQDVRIKKGLVIKSKFDGLTEEEIRIIKKNFKQVTIRDGIPFLPAFLITYILWIVLWYSGTSFIGNIIRLF